MSDKYIEKIFLYLLVGSLLLHVAIFTLITIFPQEKKVAKQEPYMVELRDLPEPKKSPGKAEKEPRRLSEQKRRVEKEMAPKGERERDRIAALPRKLPRPAPVQPQVRRVPRQTPQRPVTGGVHGAQRPAERGDYPVRRDLRPKEGPAGGDFFRQKRDRLPDVAKLLPSADKMAKLEDSYRKKYGPEVEEGETKFLNTEDILFGSFLRRFENAVYGVWRYPSEAAQMGIEGTTPVRITFNRAGEIVNVEILETGSGSKILDKEVVRTLHSIGPIGSFPKGYQKDTFKLIAFFQYGIGRRSLH